MQENNVIDLHVLINFYPDIDIERAEQFIHNALMEADIVQDIAIERIQQA
jgi:hypothetical protein